MAYVALGLLLQWSRGAIFLLAWWLMRGLFSDAATDWQGMFLRYTAIAITVGLLGLAAFQNHWRTRQLAVRAKQSELEALQARIRPHFLFNTLNTGAALVHQRPGETERLLLDLADLFRAALAGPREIPSGGGTGAGADAIWKSRACASAIGFAWTGVCRRHCPG